MSHRLSSFALSFLALIGGIAWGNHEGDRLTLRDCATTGKAKLAGGGTITCEVQKESK